MLRHLHIAALAAFFVVCLTHHAALAKVQLPSIFGEGMVLQRDQKLCIWGKATPREQVQITLDNQSKSTVADAGGDWQVFLNPMSAGKSGSLTVQGSNKVVINNVKIGDVYLCSGQSNMAFPLGASDVTTEDLSGLDKLQLAIYTTPLLVSKTEIFDAHGAWKPITSATVKSLPAIPYQFGRALSLAQKIPIGIISVPCSGAAIETFLPPETIKRMHCETVPFLPAGVVGNNFRTLLYPCLKVTLRGMVWYQGEANFLNAAHYREVFPAFITDLRKRMNAPDLPFYFVQLPAYGWREEDIKDSFWADLREAQSAALALPNVHMVVSIDTSSDAPPLHPKEKRQIAIRLAHLAEARTAAGIAAGAGAGAGLNALKLPTVSRVTMQDDGITVTFSGITKPLTTSDDRSPRGFQLAGANRKFYWAQAKLTGDSVTVTSDDVLVPQAVRYAYTDNPDSNVCIDGGLPLPPFRTDKWPTSPKLNPAARETASSR